jgi:hypothetical protein
VRPFRPLLILTIVATVFAIGRYVRQRGRRIGERGTVSPQRGRLRRAQGQCASFSTCLLDTFALAVPRWGGRQELGLAERLQVIVYRVLLVCALIGLANSNPTLRNMVDTLL